jgi:hypothetical protein
MKTNIFSIVIRILLPAAVLSCGQPDETPSPAGEAIGFDSASIDAPSPESASLRTGATDRDSLYASGFRVSAYLTGLNTWSGVGSMTLPTFMHNQDVKRAGNAWTYSPVRYWPPRMDGQQYGRLSFFAWNDGTGAVVSGADRPGAPTLTYTVPSASSAQKDLVAAVLTDQTSENSPLRFTFRHTLTRIGFKARLKEAYGGVTVSVTSLRVSYTAAVKGSGVYTFASASGGTGAWGGLSGAMSQSDNVLSGDVPLPATDTRLNGEDKYLMLLPQTIANKGDVSVELAYSITAGGATTPYTATVPLPATEWPMGRDVSYAFIVSLTGVTFAGLTVTPWTTDTEALHSRVTYKANGGVGADITDNVWSWPNLSAYTLRANAFTPPYMSFFDAVSFIEWNTKPDGTGTMYQPGDAAPEGITVLYARWTDPVKDFTYTGAVQTFTAQQDGVYQLEAWGASGGTGYSVSGAGGAGGYSRGKIPLKEGQVIYVYVGCKTDFNSTIGVTHTFNGGGRNTVYSGTDNADTQSGIGGGATDFRLFKTEDGAWDNAMSLNSRILVAGGGGGGGSDKSLINKGADGGYGGGLIAGEGKMYPLDTSTNAVAGGGTQMAGGDSAVIFPNVGPYVYPKKGSFGAGGTIAYHGGGGGGGYYGGGSGSIKHNRGIVAGGGGGSSFISGMIGCRAIDPASETEPRTPDSGSTATDKATLNYSTDKFGASPTWVNSAAITFTDCSMIDGQGYEWKTGARADAAGTMPDWSNAGAPVTGNTGHGHARITLVP